MVSVIQAVSGGEHTLIRTTNGVVYSSGACGLNWCRSKKMYSSLYGWRQVKPTLPVRFSHLHASFYHNLAISTTGTVYSWGCGTFVDGSNDGIIPALGPNTFQDLGGPPVTVPVPGKAVAVTGGAYHSVVLNEAGAVYTFGANQLGQLGRSLSSKADVDGAGLPIDAYPHAVEGIDESESVRTIGAAFYNTFVVCKSGALYCSGENQNAQCGQGKKNLHAMERVHELKNTKVVKAVGGYCHNLFLDDQGCVHSMGCGDEGNRGNGVPEEKYEDEESKRPVTNQIQLPSGERAVDIACGANHSIILGRDHVYTFGSNEYGQLGLKTGSNDREDENDENDNDDNDDDGEENTSCVLSPTRISLPLDAGKVVSVSGGYAHTTLFCENGNVYTFGNNENGQLGLGSEEGMRTECVSVPFKVNEELNSSKIT